MTWLPLSQLDETEHSWRIQGNTVQFGGTGTYRKLRGCDPATFEVFVEPGSLIARDRNHVYHGAELLSAVQRDSFTHLGEGYWRDADAIYCEYETALRPLNGSDAATFRHLGEGYAADRAQAYYGGSKIQSANPLALRLLHGLYAADGDTVFFDGKPLKGSDPQTWREAAGEAGRHGFSHDGKHVYILRTQTPPRRCRHLAAPARHPFQRRKTRLQNQPHPARCRPCRMGRRQSRRPRRRRIRPPRRKLRQNERTAEKPLAKRVNRLSQRLPENTPPTAFR
ncbi:DKNYY domain-containing protein [Eikenella halliae]|uniref:DKNYY domain-containing protein n=1 Tax=Eikenella halliae TaxID=1795832 RepID=A0A1B6VZ56_9NEIS|nr:DKNYY domain-containing protein [Eikenella halliae]OAM43463.1 hypothetical protein A7Q00_06085 [Eikenella halliae]